MTEQLALEPEGEVTPETDADASPETPEVVTEPEGQTQQTEGKESEADPSPAADDPGDKPDAVTKGVQERIDELTRLRREAERDRDYWRQMATKPAEQEPVKTLEDFNYDDKQFSAYSAERAAKQAAQATREEMARAAQEEAMQRRHALFAAKEAEFAATAPDYFNLQEVVGRSITPHMAEAIQGSDEGPAIVHYLGKNPEIRSYIAQLSPISAARELGRIEARLVSERSKPKPPPVSKAPPPAAKIAPTDPGVEKDPAKMTDAEFAKWRRKQIAQRS